MDGPGGFGARCHGIAFMVDLDDSDSLASGAPFHGDAQPDGVS
jgi:hypothetical protein